MVTSGPDFSTDITLIVAEMFNQGSFTVRSQKVMGESSHKKEAAEPVTYTDMKLTPTHDVTTRDRAALSSVGLQTRLVSRWFW